MIDLPKDKEIILFDGVCNFWNNTVLWIIRFDKKNKFVFASLQNYCSCSACDSFLAKDALKIVSVKM